MANDDDSDDENAYDDEEEEEAGDDNVADGDNEHFVVRGSFRGSSFVVVGA